MPPDAPDKFQLTAQLCAPDVVLALTFIDLVFPYALAYVLIEEFEAAGAMLIIASYVPPVATKLPEELY